MKYSKIIDYIVLFGILIVILSFSIAVSIWIDPFHRNCNYELYDSKGNFIDTCGGYTKDRYYACNEYDHIQSGVIAVKEVCE